MIITTADSSSEQSVARAQMLAQELQCRYVTRQRHSVSKLYSIYKDSDMIIITDQEIRYVHPEKPAMHFHPSMSFVRVKRLLRGENDPMLDIADIQPGDTVLDCTAGLGSDSIVFSYGVGIRGRVISLESQLPLFALVREGLQTYQTEVEAMNEAMRRIQMKHVSHDAYLRELPDRSVDVVYFDPMFREPLMDSSALNSLRDLANHAALTEESIEHAKRVARKSVVLKEQRDSSEFERLGFSCVHRNPSKITYGVIHIDNNES
ncbi:class I SAM-dependent methyltransferase [Paenibacillus terrigena]|uniref:class I SAM-dependent methyltransferase n=1 Tax=Paenibacillus terrigena TaxID=369333 RepID=UPI00037541B7|nr:class I SAM-dependent methyltransferase [Paenibacillus terrigena]